MGLAGVWRALTRSRGPRVRPTGVEPCLHRPGLCRSSNRSVAFEGAARQNGRRVPGPGSHGQHWRVTIAAVGIGGHADDFIGQYHRNSNATLTLRYSF